MAFKMNTGFLSFKIKAVAKEPKKEKKTTNSSYLTTGIIVKENDDYFVKINNSESEDSKYNLTEQSFSIYDRTVIYSRKPDKKGVHTAVIRSHNDAKLTSGISSIYLPFKPNIKVKGKIVTIAGIKAFDLVEVCYPESYVSY